MYLYNKNVLEYEQIAQSIPKSMTHDIEGLSKLRFTKLQYDISGSTVEHSLVS